MFSPERERLRRFLSMRFRMNAIDLDNADRLWRAHRADLAQIDARDRRRVLTPRRGRDFASNDYLALSGSARLRDAIGAAIARGVPAGSGGSRLLRGNDPEHEALAA